MAKIDNIIIYFIAITNNLTMETGADKGYDQGIGRFARSMARTEAILGPR